ncbi:MAG: glycosyltransferase family 39 protein [Planctomycetota bacterium]
MARREKTGQPVSYSGGPKEERCWFESAWPVRLVAFIFLVGLAAYLVFFYHVKVGADVYSYQRLAFLLLPDELLLSWCGGEVGGVKILDRAWPIGVASVIWGAAGLLGWLILDVLRVDKHLDRVEATALAFGLGLNGVSLFSLVVGLLGGLGQPAWFVLLALSLITAVGWRQWQRGGPRHARAGGAAARYMSANEAIPRRWTRPRWWWAVVPFAFVLLAGGVLPPVHFDVLEYHLQVPKEWCQQGSVTFLPHNVYGNMPLGGEMLATQAMPLMPGPLSWWWGALAGKLAMACYTILTTVLIFAAGRRFYSAHAGIFAALIYISTAWVAFVSLNGLNEGIVAYYLFASFYAGKLWWDTRREDARPQWGLLALTGLLAGAATSCKYTSLLFVAPPLLILVFSGGRGYRVRASFVFLLAAGLACGLWFGKNWVYTGNPTYPLLVSVFGGETRTPEKDAQWRKAHQVPRNSQGHRYSFAQAGKSLLKVLGGSWRQNPLLVPCAALLLLRRRRNRDIAYWAAMLVFVMVAWWAGTHRLDRFWVPAIPVMALLAGVGAAWSSSGLWRRFMVTVIAVMLVVNFVSITAPGLADNRYFVSLEQLRDDPRLRQATNKQRTIAFGYLHRHVPAGCRVLVVGEAAVFNLRVPVLYNTCFDDCVFERIFRGRTEAQRRTRLAELGISHVYIDWSELRRYRQPGNYGYSSYVTPPLVHNELVGGQQLLRQVKVPELDPELGEIFTVRDEPPGLAKE